MMMMKLNDVLCTAPCSLIPIGEERYIFFMPKGSTQGVFVCL